MLWCFSEENAVALARRTILLSTLFLVSCQSQQPSEADSSATAVSREEQVPKPKSAPNPDVMSLVTNGDRLACVDPEIQEIVKKITTPKFIDERDQISRNNFSSSKRGVVSIDQWNGYWRDNTSLENVVAVEFDDFSKKLKCQSNINFYPYGEFLIYYSVQPTADNSDLNIEVFGEIFSEPLKYKVRGKLYDSVTSYYDSETED
ncbi:hypothetical protein NJ75_04629 [Novosphingobium subterraneum]|uniref:Uncharacterized protein n=2 Tax=Novosphingobium subterraneum TaxID=48936 RepID=A0A0B8Z5V4_9SPHN|nr:hypothetical protein NJ75_04629 [Novosphingobium subterraneum]